MHGDQQAHEAGLSHFMQSVHQPRFRDSMRNEELRVKLRDQLAHFKWIDERYAESPGPLEIDALTQRLRSLGAPDTCFVVSEEKALDGRTMPLRDALSAVLWGDYETLISCVPGRLAFYCDEARLDVAILVRHS